MKEQKTQLFFYENNEFEFVRRDSKFTCLLQMEGEKIVKAWKHFYANQLQFAGYKNMSAGTVSLGYNNDIILDPFDKIPVTEDLTGKPDVSKRDKIKKWIAQIAENQRHYYRSKRQTVGSQDRIQWTLIGIIFLIAIAWGIKYATG